MLMGLAMWLAACSDDGETTPPEPTIIDRNWQYVCLRENRTDSTQINMDLTYKLTLWIFTSYYNTLDVVDWKTDVETFSHSFYEYRLSADTVSIDFHVPLTLTVSELTDTTLVLNCNQGEGKSSFDYFFRLYEGEILWE